MKSNAKELLKEVMLSSEYSSWNVICNAVGGTFRPSGAVKKIIELKFVKANRVRNRISQRPKASRLTPYTQTALHGDKKQVKDWVSVARIVNKATSLALVPHAQALSR